MEKKLIICTSLVATTFGSIPVSAGMLDANGISKTEITEVNENVTFDSDILGDSDLSLSPESGGIEEPKINQAELLDMGVTRGNGTWVSSGGRWWYKHYDGTYPANMWEEIDGIWYHFDASGWMETDKWIEDGGKWYYVNSSGAMVVNSWMQLGGKWYYFDGYGVMSTGWKEITYQGKLEWFYFDNTGAMINYNVSIGEEYTMYFQSNGVWLYTVSLIKWDLVDQGKHLDWGGTSVYLSGIASAVGKWNSYKSNVIRRSNITNAQDVTLSDYYTTTNTNAYTTQGGQMVFNTFRMSNSQITRELLL